MKRSRWKIGRGVGVGGEEEQMKDSTEDGAGDE